MSAVGGALPTKAELDARMRELGMLPQPRYRVVTSRKPNREGEHFILREPDTFVAKVYNIDGGKAIAIQIAMMLNRTKQPDPKQQPLL